MMRDDAPDEVRDDAPDDALGGSLRCALQRPPQGVRERLVMSMSSHEIQTSPG